MKAFLISLISAVALASGDEEDLKNIVGVYSSDPSVENTIPPGEDSIGQHVTWRTEWIKEKYKAPGTDSKKKPVE